MRSPAPSSSMSPVSDASPGNAAGSVAAPTPSSRTNVTTGTERCSTVHTPRPFGSCRLAIRGKWNTGSGPSSGSRERSTRVTAPPPVPSRRSRDRVLPARHDAERHAPIGHAGTAARGRAARPTDALLVPREVAIEVARLVQEHGVGVQLVGLAAKPADRLQPVDELRLRLREAALELVFGRPVAGQRRDLLERRPARSPRACAPARQSR